MTINELIKRYDGDSVILGVIQELDYLRRSQMQRAEKYLSNTEQQQWNHIQSEGMEVGQAIEKCWGVGWHINGDEKEHLIEEIIDLQFSCQTMLEGPLKLTKTQIADAVQRVVQKNKDREYDKQP